MKRVATANGIGSSSGVSLVAYSDGIEAERIIFKTLLEKYRLDKVELDQLVGAVNASGAALAVEMYIAGFWMEGIQRKHSREERYRMIGGDNNPPDII